MSCKNMEPAHPKIANIAVRPILPIAIFIYKDVPESALRSPIIFIVVVFCPILSDKPRSNVPEP